MIRLTKRSEAAADSFLTALGHEDKGMIDDVRTLVQVAFRLYELDWPGHDIRSWVWPLAALAGEDNQSFDRGDQPWTVLLRRAVRIQLGPRP